jgi:hypothetical protein
MNREAQKTISDLNVGDEVVVGCGTIWWMGVNLKGCRGKIVRIDSKDTAYTGYLVLLYLGEPRFFFFSPRDLRHPMVCACGDPACPCGVGILPEKEEGHHDRRGSP